MQLNLELNNANNNRIKSYTEHSITIKDIVYQQSLIVTPTEILNWSIQKSQDFSLQDAELLLQFQPDIIILATGNKLELIPTEFSSYILAKNIGLEQMTIGAACRTYSILLADERKVVAGFILP